MAKRKESELVVANIADCQEEVQRIFKKAVAARDMAQECVSDLLKLSHAITAAQAKVARDELANLTGAANAE